jgi:molybdopterin-binding protein
LAGTIRSIDVGAVNTKVTIELAGGQQVVSVITKESAANLGLAVGKAAYAIIKASDVMVGVD